MSENVKPEVAMVDRILPVMADDVAPDGSIVRLLARATRGGMAHFELAAGDTSIAQQHRSVEEIWFVLEGFGQMWRQSAEGSSQILDMRPGVSMTIPVATQFQFRNTGGVPLSAIGVTMPPWPGPDEAVEIDGPWASSIHRGRGVATALGPRPAEPS